VRTVYLGQSVLAGFLVTAPIGDTTVLLLFSLSLEILLTLMLVRERRLRLRSGPQQIGSVVTPFPLLARTAPHLRARRVMASHRFVMPQDPSSRWRNAPRKATS
jgi:hypothetical protein